jgi:diaminopropionate ammonia-lyase
MDSLTNNMQRLTEHFQNDRKTIGAYPQNLRVALSSIDTQEALNEIKSWKGYKSTQLRSLQGFAEEIGVQDIFYKDESTRFDLGSFKALGGAYGVLKFIQNQLTKDLNKNISIRDIRDGKYLDLTKNYTVVTATDGNHGRSVAYGAKLSGCKCQIYIHAEVSKGRQHAMEEFGAMVIRIRGNYDESLRICIEEAIKNNWQIISDTSYEGYTKYPRYIMAGYTVLAHEITEQLDYENMPTHIFLQAGVGGFAAAIMAYFWEKYAEKNIKFIIVEPTLAPCLIESAKANKLKVFDIEKETMMAGLSCGEPSLLAWKILNLGTDHFMTITDDRIPDLMRLLAKGMSKDLPIEAGECSASGLAALIEAMSNDSIAKKMSLNQNSRILLFGTEGATDPDIYKAIINA